MNYCNDGDSDTFAAITCVICPRFVPKKLYTFDRGYVVDIA